MRSDRGASGGRAKYGHLFKGFTFDFNPFADEGEEEMSAQLLGGVHLQERVQEVVEALVIDFLGKNTTHIDFREVDNKNINFLIIQLCLRRKLRLVM